MVAGFCFPKAVMSTVLSENSSTVTVNYWAHEKLQYSNRNYCRKPTVNRKMLTVLTVNSKVKVKLFDHKHAKIAKTTEKMTQFCSIFLHFHDRTPFLNVKSENKWLQYCLFHRKYLQTKPKIVKNCTKCAKTLLVLRFSKLDSTP